MPWPYRLLLLLNIGLCLYGSLWKSLPSWRMFQKVDPLSYEIKDREGKAIDPFSYLPSGVYLTNVKVLGKVVSFVCSTNPERAPFFLHEKFSNTSLTYPKDSCEAPL